MSGIAMLGMTLVSAVATIAIGGYDILNGDRTDPKKPDQETATATVPVAPPLPPLAPLTGPAPPAHVKRETTQDADDKFLNTLSSKISRAFPRIDGKDSDGATYDSYSARVVNHVCNRDTLEFDDGQDATEHLKFMAAMVLLCRGSADLVFLKDKDSSASASVDPKDPKDPTKPAKTGWQRLCWANKPIVVVMRYGEDFSRSFYEIVVYHARERQTFYFTCSVNGGDRGMLRGELQDLLNNMGDGKDLQDVKSMVRRYSGNTMYSTPPADMVGRDNCMYTLAAIVMDVPDWRDRIDDDFKSRDCMEFVSEALKEHGINTGKYEQRRPGINEEPKKDNNDKNKQNNQNNKKPKKWVIKNGKPVQV